MNIRNSIIITITGQQEGSGYLGMPEKRNYRLQVHGTKPHTVTIDSKGLTEMKNNISLEQASDGWYFDSGKKITHIKVKEQKANSSFTATLLQDSSGK